MMYAARWINRKANAALVIGFIALVGSLTGVAAATAPTPRAHAARIIRGPRGPRGFRGPQGPAGPNARTQLQYVSAAAPYCAFGGGACAVVAVTATCPAGTVATGGSASTDTIETPISTIVDDTSYWALSDNGYDGAGGTLRVTVACASGAVADTGTSRDHASADAASTAKQRLLRMLRAQAR